jgi:hypothetical protein
MTSSRVAGRKRLGEATRAAVATGIAALPEGVKTYSLSGVVGVNKKSVADINPDVQIVIKKDKIPWAQFVPSDRSSKGLQCKSGMRQLEMAALPEDPLNESRRIESVARIRTAEPIARAPLGQSESRCLRSKAFRMRLCNRRRSHHADHDNNECSD